MCLMQYISEHSPPSCAVCFTAGMFFPEHILSVNDHYGDEHDYRIGGTFCACAPYDSKQHIGWNRDSVFCPQTVCVIQ